VSEEFILEAFIRDRVFRPDSAILVLVKMESGKLPIWEIINCLRPGKIAPRLIKWDVESDWKNPRSKVRKTTRNSVIPG